MMHRYRLSGWRVASDHPLPYLTNDGGDGAGDPDVTIRRGELDAAIGPARAIGPFAIHDAGHVDFRPDAALAIRIEKGCRITRDVRRPIDAAEWHTLLTGPAFAVLAHQRGVPPLHAGAIRLPDDAGGGAIAIAGHSGAGKSTLVAALTARGHAMLTDDQLIADPHTLAVQPGSPSTKLWAVSARAIGWHPREADRIKPGHDKFHHVPEDAHAAVPQRLRAIALLAPGDVAIPAIQRLRRGEAVAALARLAHYGEIATAMGLARATLDHAARIAGIVPVFRVDRPVDFGQLDALADAVLDLPRAGEEPA